MSNRNRDSGIRLELDIIHLLTEMGYDAVSSRSESRRADAAGIDIISDYPFKIQCKSGVNQPNIYKLLTETEADIIIYRKQKKKGKRFYKQGDYAIVPLEDFFNLTQKANKT